MEERDRYQLKRFLTEKETRCAGRAVEGIASPDGIIEYYLTVFDPISGTSKRLGRLDPKRHWALRMIEDKNGPIGRLQHPAGGPPEDHDGGCHDGQPSERPEGGSTEGPTT